MLMATPTANTRVAVAAKTCSLPGSRPRARAKPTDTNPPRRLPRHPGCSLKSGQTPLRKQGRCGFKSRQPDRELLDNTRSFSDVPLPERRDAKDPSHLEHHGGFNSRYVHGRTQWRVRCPASGCLHEACDDPDGPKVSRHFLSVSQCSESICIVNSVRYHILI